MKSQLHNTLVLGSQQPSSYYVNSFVLSFVLNTLPFCVIWNPLFLLLYKTVTSLFTFSIPLRTDLSHLYSSLEHPHLFNYSFIAPQPQHLCIM